MDHQSDERPSPGLNMGHGFLKKIEQNQVLREKQTREDLGKRGKKVAFQTRSSKPPMEIYRPPSKYGSCLRRGSGDFSAFPTLQMSAEGVETVSWARPQSPSLGAASFSGAPQLAALSKSRSTTAAHRVHFQMQPAPPAGQQPPAKKEPGGYGLKRSKSLGSGEMKLFAAQENLDMSGFSVDIQATIKRAVEDPNRVPARQLMEIVRHIFNNVLDSCKYAEPTARLCIAIIEKEKNETFLETLLNSCREWYNERDRLFNEGGGRSGHPPMKPSRWVAYVRFLFELYTRLKSKKQSPMIATNTLPSTLILTLLSECCLLFLKPSSLMGHGEIECLFIVLTSIGRDLQNEFPPRMSMLMGAVREAFLVPSIPQKVRKTLLQLIELNASNWQLMAQAVTYYYPGNQRE